MEYLFNEYFPFIIFILNMLWFVGIPVLLLLIAYIIFIFKVDNMRGSLPKKLIKSKK